MGVTINLLSYVTFHILNITRNVLMKTDNPQKTVYLWDIPVCLWDVPLCVEGHPSLLMRCPSQLVVSQSAYEMTHSQLRGIPVCLWDVLHRPERCPVYLHDDPPKLEKCSSLPEGCPTLAMGYPNILLACSIQLEECSSLLVYKYTSYHLLSHTNHLHNP